jgi:hypothetical protein
MNINGETKKSFISDIFGRNVEGAFESGLSDAKDPEEFAVMLDSVLDPKGEQFHSWFKNNKAKEFAESVISSVRQILFVWGIQGCASDVIRHYTTVRNALQQHYLFEYQNYLTSNNLFPHPKVIARIKHAVIKHWYYCITRCTQ